MSVRSEPQRPPRRSASHGTLRSSYSSHGRPALGPSPLHLLHKPLRSVNENSVLLQSPGALESMLKTTTETGDIGIFSIKPVPPSPQSRGTFSNHGQLRPPPRLAADERYRRNTGRVPFAARDSTSDILSMYGSESQRSAASTLSPASTMAIGQRSYSMTTCGSRHLSHYKSTTTLQSQTSAGPLQRPRSPFPYPARLKRPGVRPASPALTENGRVDYSRMVEIDRISYRTGSSYLKPSYPPMGRRPAPLGLRSDANRSTPSLPPPGLPPFYHRPPGPSSLRTSSAASMASWSAPLREKPDNTSRTSSLTSVVNMYHRMPPPIRALSGNLSLPPPMPRYYDYTEDFDTKQPGSSTLGQPIAPVPRRSSDCHRPLVLQEPEEQLAAVFGEGDSAFFDTTSHDDDIIESGPISQDGVPRGESRLASAEQRSSLSQVGSTRSRPLSANSDNRPNNVDGSRLSDIDLLPSQKGRSSIDTFNPNLDVETGDVTVYNYTGYLATATPKTKTKSPERHVQVFGRTPTIRSEQGVILRDDAEALPIADTDEGGNAQLQAVLSEPKNPRDENARRSCSEPAQKTHSSSNHHKILLDCRRRYLSTGQTPANYPSDENVQEEKEAGKTPHSVAGNEQLQVDAVKRTPSAKEPVRRVDIPAEGGDALKLSSRESEDAQDHQFRRHRRNRAALKISTTDLPREDNEGYPHITPSCSTTPLISPKPISPARQLKVKNSIPQLMKALPPIPGDDAYTLPPTPNTTGEEDEFAEVLTPFSFTKGLNSRFQEDTTTNRHWPRFHREGAINLQKNIPKLRLRVKKSNSSDTANLLPCKTETTGSGDTVIATPSGTRLEDVKSTASSHRVRPGLKLKLSGTARAPLDDTIRHTPAAEKSDIISDIANQLPQDLFNMSITQRSKASSRASPTGRDLSSVKSINTSSGDPERHFERKESSTIATFSSSITGKSRLKENRKVKARRMRGLKRYLSNLRRLLARSPGSIATPTENTSVTSHTVGDKKEHALNTDFGSAIDILRVKNVTTGTRVSTCEYTRARRSHQLRARLNRWVKGAKSAARRYTKKGQGA
ncbi:hypothetical protein F4778DRAFT_714938 [Xylariomycetidae sp. FL2044]|nr:hypothetical protein F4778DRAFT_714938 [Xylariomycetidae sp. FL2044]